MGLCVTKLEYHTKLLGLGRNIGDKKKPIAWISSQKATVNDLDMIISNTNASSDELLTFEYFFVSSTWNAPNRQWDRPQIKHKDVKVKTHNMHLDNGLIIDHTAQTHLQWACNIKSALCLWSFIVK
jgi:hypothetical protein